MSSFSQNIKTLRRYISKLPVSKISLDKILFDFIDEFEASFSDLALQFLLIEGSSCWQYYEKSKREVQPEYDGFIHHLKRIQSKRIFQSKSYRTESSIANLFKEQKLTFGLPFALISGKRLWALLGCDSSDKITEAKIKKISGLIEKLTGSLSLCDYSEVQKIADRNIAQEEAVATLVHQLKSPLVSLSGALSKVDKSTKQAQRKKIVQECHQKIKQTRSLISAYLDFLKINKLSLSPVPVHDVIKEIQAFYRFPLKEAGIRLTVQYSGAYKSLKILGHPFMAFQVLQNLVDNSIKAVGRGGEIFVKIYSEEVRQEEEEWIQVLVSDSGSGIAPDIVDKIFEPFFSRFGNGHGLGLSICRRIMELHEGSISYVKPHKKQERGFLLKFREA